MSALEDIGATLPDTAKDIRLNLSAVLGGSTLAPAQRWGVALAAAFAARNARLQTALAADAHADIDEKVIEDAQAAVALMAMNNVYYRFKHVIGKESYARLPARLRMNRLARPAGSKVDFELYALAVSAINGCEACMRAHERTVVEGGLTEEQVHDAIRIAATVHAAAVALEIAAGTEPVARPTPSAAPSLLPT